MVSKMNELVLFLVSLASGARCTLAAKAILSKIDIVGTSMQHRVTQLISVLRDSIKIKVSTPVMNYILSGRCL